MQKFHSVDDDAAILKMFIDDKIHWMDLCFMTWVVKIATFFFSLKTKPTFFEKLHEKKTIEFNNLNIQKVDFKACLTTSHSPLRIYMWRIILSLSVCSEFAKQYHCQRERFETVYKFLSERASLPFSFCLLSVCGYCTDFVYYIENSK